MSSQLHTTAFCLLKGMTPRLAEEILGHVGSAEEFFALSDASITSRIGMKTNMFSAAVRSQAMARAESELEFASRHNVRCIAYTDPAYPRRLLECTDAPAMMFATGNTDLNAAHVVSIVGTRNATIYGVNFINKLVDALAERLDNVVIVSGLAMGCDITAHRRAMERGVPTVGVVAHGIDTLYPAEHRNYAAKMVREGGMVLTDYTHGTRPHRGNFLARNRIVAGMSDAVIVAESAAERGGALHTAKLAMLYDRDVFALPGRTSDHYSAGCNKLIKTNVAHLIEDADDLITHMNWTTRPQPGQQATLFPELSPEQQAVMEYLRTNGEGQVNTLTAHLGIPAGKLLGILTEMEFQGLLLALPGARYRIA